MLVFIVYWLSLNLIVYSIDANASGTQYEYYSNIYEIVMTTITSQGTVFRIVDINLPPPLRKYLCLNGLWLLNSLPHVPFHEHPQNDSVSVPVEMSNQMR